MISDAGDYGGDIADWGGDIIINRDIILDIILDILRDRVGDIPIANPIEFVDVKIESVGKRKGVAPSSKELAALRKAIVDRLNKGG